jgi:hypothetical protein
MSEPKKLIGTGRIEYSRDRVTLEERYMCDYADWQTYAPTIGSQHSTYSALRCSNVSIEGVGTITQESGQTTYQYAVITATYEAAVQGEPIPGAPARIRWQGEVEWLKTAVGYRWTDTNEIIEDDEVSIALPFPHATLAIECACYNNPLQTLFALSGKVNAYEWRGNAPESLLLTQYTVVPTADLAGRTYYVWTAEMLWRPISHNQIWRPPSPDVNADGTWARYQGRDPNMPNYTSDASKIGRLVYKSGTAGQGAWTTTTPRLYESADYSALDPYMNGG